jgi:hypothetical protein
MACGLALDVVEKRRHVSLDSLELLVGYSDDVKETRDAFPNLFEFDLHRLSSKARSQPAGADSGRLASLFCRGPLRLVDNIELFRPPVSKSAAQKKNARTVGRSGRSVRAFADALQILRACQRLSAEHLNPITLYPCGAQQANLPYKNNFASCLKLLLTLPFAKLRIASVQYMSIIVGNLEYVCLVK